jgi:hypothetical protein
MRFHFSTLITASVITLWWPLQGSGADGFFLTNEEGNYSLRLNGFAQVRYSALREPAQPGRQSFDLALGRASFSGSVYDPKLSYFVQAETSTMGDSSRVHLLDGWVQYRFSPHLTVQTGRLLLPYSRQFYTHPGELLFSDLSVADYMFNLPRSTGAHAWGKAGRFTYHFAAANSIRALDAGGRRNSGSALATVARLDFDVLRPYGFLETSPTPVSSPQLTVGIAAANNPVVEASALQNVAAGDKTKNATADAGFRWRRVSLQAAGYSRWNHTRSTGAYAQAGYLIVPRRWEAAARFSEARFDSRPLREYALGVNRYFHEHHLKIQADYVLTDNAGLVSRANGHSHGFRLQGQLFF